MANPLQRAYQGAISRLSRVQGSATLVPELESLRFVAIVSVFLFHLNGYLLAKSSAAWALAGRDSLQDRLLQQGGYGVQLFFVISGFVLALPFAKQHLGLGKPVQLGPYYLRRLTRLEPPFLASLAILYAALVLYNHAPAGPLLSHLLASALYLHAACYHSMSTINCVTWSLEVEVQFYLAAPLLALVFGLGTARARRAALVLGILGMQALQYRFGWLDERSDPSLLNYLPYFLMGLLLADLYLAGGLAAGARRLAWDGLSLLGWPLLLGLAMARPDWMPWILPWALLALFAAFFRGRFFRWALSGSFPVTVGGMCYSIYLFHFTLISALARFTKGLGLPGGYLPNYLLQFLLVGSITLGLASVFFALVERPCMRRDWPQRLWARMTGRPPSPPLKVPA